MGVKSDPKEVLDRSWIPAVQGYLTYRKMQPPRTLPQASA